MAGPPRRLSGGWLLAVVGFVLVAPGTFVLAPLAGLLLAARPASRWEWAWIGAGVASVAVWAVVPAGLSTQFVRAFGVMLAGAFTLLIALAPQRPQRQALLAVAMTALGASIWLLVLGFNLRDVETDLARGLSAGLLAQAQLSAAVGGGIATETRRLFEQLAEQSGAMAALLPATVMLTSLAGLALAWRGFHQLSRHAWGNPPPPFARFTFNDHAIWLLVLAVGLAFVPLGDTPAVPSAAANLLAVMLVLYAVRGAAIFRASVTTVSGLALTLFILVTVVMWAFVLAGLTLLGIADTWLDFRRRAAAPPTGGK